MYKLFYFSVIKKNGRIKPQIQQSTVVFEQRCGSADKF